MSQKKTLYVGDQWEVDNTITDPRTKAAVDPASLTVTVRKPDGTESTVTATKTAGGKYTAKVLLTAHGTWHMTWTSPSGTYIGVETIEVSVKKAPTP